MLYLPPGYQSGSKLPMLVEVYGGPGFQKVLNFALCSSIPPSLSSLEMVNVSDILG